MSAFVLGKEHIAAMVRGAWASRDFSWYDGAAWHTLDYQTALGVGRMLLDANVRSVAYRYPDERIEDLPGPLSHEWTEPFMDWYPTRRCPSPVSLLKLISCYEYQSCEVPGFEQSEAYRFCQALRASAIGRLPGYEEGPWEWTD